MTPAPSFICRSTPQGKLLGEAAVAQVEHISASMKLLVIAVSSR